MRDELQLYRQLRKASETWHAKHGTEIMKYSKNGLLMTEKFEGLRLKAYQDQGGVWTIGYGHTGPEVRQGMEITQLEAENLLIKDVEIAENFVNYFVKVHLNQNEFDALVDFTFNLGGGNLQKSTLLRLVNAGKFAEAAGEFHKWDKCCGIPLAGLLRRREAEATLFIRK